nr:hypothetical protein GCM10020093_040210 [Planobispora longispora]
MPEFKKNGTTLRVECARDGDRVRVAFWVGEELVADLVDEDAAKATGKPRFGIHVSKWPGVEAETRVYFDDFQIGRLP